MTKGWTDERRAAYSRMMKARKAWAHSTGPRTAEGKKRASGNARGKGCRQRLDAELAPVEALMREWEVVRRGRWKAPACLLKKVRSLANAPRQRA